MSTSSTVTEMNPSSNGVLPISTQPTLIRKKLGELVKSSLKLSGLIKSMSSPQLLRNKSVRFATRLTNIRMFDGAASPLAISNNNSPLHTPPLDEDELRFKSPRDYFEWNYTDSLSEIICTNDDSSDSDSDDCLDSNSWYSSTNRSFELEYTDISRPHQYFYQQQFIDKPVHLHSIQLSTINKITYLNGFVNVQNLAFEKSLMFKLTLNNWRTNVTIFSSASHVITYNKSLNDGSIDQFKFRISLQDLLCNSPDINLKKNPQFNIEMCVKYAVANQEFWDNNNNKNYKLSIRSFTRTNDYSSSNTIKSYSYEPKKTSPVPQEKFDDLLVSKLVDYQQTSPTKKKSDFFNRYNSINDEFNSTSFVSRPELPKSYSTSDILSAKPRYSNSYKSKHKTSVSATNTNKESDSVWSPIKTKDSDSSSIDLTNTQFNSSSYSALLANFCFSGGNEKKDTTNKLVLTDSKPLVTNNSTPILTNHCSIPSTASTFHSFSDSIHI